MTNDMFQCDHCGNYSSIDYGYTIDIVNNKGEVSKDCTICEKCWQEAQQCDDCGALTFHPTTEVLPCTDNIMTYCPLCARERAKAMQTTVNLMIATLREYGEEATS